MKSTNTNTKLHMTSEMNKGYLNYMNIETFTSTLERVNQLELELSTLKDQLKTHDEYSNCENTLLFLGIEENAYFTAEEAVRNIMKTMIFLPTQMPYTVSFKSVIRIGSCNKQRNRPRPISVTFASFRDREVVRKASPCLRNTDYAIREQFPIEVLNRRRLLTPLLRDARKKNRYAVLYRDVLRIDNEEWRIDAHGRPYVTPYVIEQTHSTVTTQQQSSQHIYERQQPNEQSTSTQSNTTPQSTNLSSQPCTAPFHRPEIETILQQQQNEHLAPDPTPIESLCNQQQVTTSTSATIYTPTPSQRPPDQLISVNSEQLPSQTYQLEPVWNQQQVMPSPSATSSQRPPDQRKSVNSEQQHTAVTTQPLHTTTPSHHTPETVHQLEIHTPTPCQHPPDHQELYDPALSTCSPKTTYQPELHKQTPLNHPPINHLTPAPFDHRPPETFYLLERTCNDPAPSPQSPTSKYQPELLARISSSIENAISNSSFGHRLDQMNRSMEEYIRKCNLELPN